MSTGGVGGGGFGLGATRTIWGLFCMCREMTWRPFQVICHCIKLQSS